MDGGVDGAALSRASVGIVGVLAEIVVPAPELPVFVDGVELGCAELVVFLLGLEHVLVVEALRVVVAQLG